MSLSHLTDAELLRQAHVEIDSLTSTPLELELLRRFELVAESAVISTAEEFQIDASGLKTLGDALVIDATNSAKLLHTVHEAGYDDPAALKADLELAESFSALATDAGDVFARLSTLTATATQE